MNLITGRATRWTEAWDVAGGGSDPGAAAFVASTRKASALPKNAADAATAVEKELDDALGSGAFCTIFFHPSVARFQHLIAWDPFN